MTVKYWENHLKDIWGNPQNEEDATVEAINKCKFHDKTVSSEEAFAHLQNIAANHNTAFLFSKNLKG